MPSKTQSESPAAPPAVGSYIDGGALQLVEVLGVGGYGVVYRAVDTSSSSFRNPKSYAVKCLTHSQKNARQRQLHLREITLHQLASSHAGVVTLHRVVEDSKHTFIVMDYASDGDLFTQILNHCRYLGDDYLIKHVFLQMIDAVEHCHNLGIYHRDLKPENVLCFDGGLRVAITDFGLATSDKLSDEFRTGSVYHMSPECQGGAFAPQGTYSPQANDIWSLAIVLLNLATGRNPWKAACASDPTFQAYLHDPTGFLPTVLPISWEANSILVRMLDVDWRRRMTLKELRKAIYELDTFYSDGCVFEGSMARCPWEAGLEIEADEEVEKKEDDLRSEWSQDSCDMVDEAMEASSWMNYSTSSNDWGTHSPIAYTPQTPRFDHSHSDTPSALSSSDSDSLPSPPMTPNFNMDFEHAVGQPPMITINTDLGHTRYFETSLSNGPESSISMMHTAVDMGASSFFLPSPVTACSATGKETLPAAVDFAQRMSPTRSNEDHEMRSSFMSLEAERQVEQDHEMGSGISQGMDLDQGFSSWDFSSSSTSTCLSLASFPSMYSSGSNSDSNSYSNSTTTSTGNSGGAWSPPRSQPIAIPQPQTHQHSPVKSIFGSTFASFRPPTPTFVKRSPEEKTRVGGLFNKFTHPRSRASSPSPPPAASTFPDSFFPSSFDAPSPTHANFNAKAGYPPIHAPWSAFTLPKARSPVTTQSASDSSPNWRERRTPRPARFWFSPGKLFASGGAGSS